MNSKFKFNKRFGLKWYNRLDGTYYSILIISILFTYAIVALIGNLDYERLSENADINIRERYKEFIAELIIEEEPFPVEVNSGLLDSEAAASPARQARQSSPASREQERQQIVENISKNRIFQPTSGDAYQYLPEPDELNLDNGESEYFELSRDYNSGRITSRIAQVVNNLDAGPIDRPVDNLFNYVVKRQGAIFIDLTDELVDDPNSLIGYRDPDEIERVISQYQPMIEHCFRKEARAHHIVRGYVKVEFNISYEGHVIPESIKILNSTVGSRKVDQCIKNYIKRWRSFSKLDESMGIARVTQKFIFN